MTRLHDGQDVSSGTRAGALAALLGVGLITFGVFGFPFGFGSCRRPGVPCPSPSLNEVAAYLGLVVLIIGVVMLVRSSWHGGVSGWLLAAAGAVPATWYIYELARQNLCPLLSDPAASRACLSAYGEMTAPVLSFGFGGLVLLAGWVRWRTRAASDSRAR